MIVFLDPLARWAFIAGAGLGAGAGAQLGRLSLLLLMRKSWKRQQLRQLADPRHRGEVTRPYPRVQVEHAGQYVQPGSMAGWGSLSLEPRQFALAPLEQRLKPRRRLLVALRRQPAQLRDVVVHQPHGQREGVAGGHDDSVQRNSSRAG